MEDCWHADDRKRPSFAEVINKLEEAIYVETIPDPVGRQKWMQYFNGQNRVKVGDVLDKLSTFFQFENDADRALVAEMLVAKRPWLFTVVLRYSVVIVTRCCILRGGSRGFLNCRTRLCYRRELWQVLTVLWPALR
jgi:hypothetical protein